MAFQQTPLAVRWPCMLACNQSIRMHSWCQRLCRCVSRLARLWQVWETLRRQPTTAPSRRFMTSTSVSNRTRLYVTRPKQVCCRLVCLDLAIPSISHFLSWLVDPFRSAARVTRPRVLLDDWVTESCVGTLSLSYGRAVPEPA